MEYQNPVIRGYHPDPSICRVGEDFYLVTSTFEFFPGVPVFHSKNLVEWELINHCLVRDSQLPLEDCRNSGGIFAPTIRHYNETFYMITTNITGGGNFIVTTKDSKGEWSEPLWIDQPGIDPSLFFDEDGKVYCCSTHYVNGAAGIGLFELDPNTGKRYNATQTISMGCGGKHPEAPHLYKKGAYYYLMLAEGGTEYGHMETIQRSKNPYGPYTPCPHNPILSHKNNMYSPIQATGHGDLVEDQHGNWWMVCLGIRPVDYALLHHLGRETFLAPVTWNAEGWPVVGENGTIAPVMNAALPAPLTNKNNRLFVDTFLEPTLNREWNHVRNPRREHYILSGKGLTLSAGMETLDDNHPTFVGVRQTETDCQFETTLSKVELQEGGKVGLAAYYSKDNHYEVYLTRNGEQYLVALSKRVNDITECYVQEEIDNKDSISFRIEANPRIYRFWYKTLGEWHLLGTGAVAGLCTEGTMTMTFTGTYGGLFASKGMATFTEFRRQQLTQSKEDRR